MPSIIKPKRSSVATAIPSVAQLSDGEVAVNSADRVVYLRVGAAVVPVANYVDASLLAPLASPAFTGTPTAPTQAAGNNSTRIATTAFVTAAVAAGGGGTVGFEIDGGSASTSYAGVPAFDFGSAV